MMTPQTKASASTPQTKASAISIITAPQENETYDTAPGITSIRVGANPKLIISGHSGNVTIHTSTSDAITINTYDQGTQLTQSRDKQGHDTINIVPEVLDANVNYDVTVPATTQVSIAVDSGAMSVKGVASVAINATSGSLDIENITGPVQAVSSNSNITLQNVSGLMTLRTLNGTIKANMVQGQLNAATQYGDVIVQKATLSDQSVLETAYGSVHFTGSFNPAGSYTITASSGNIVLALPANAAFQLHASTQSGSIVNTFHANSVGNTPQAQIVASVSSGSVTVQKQGN